MLKIADRPWPLSGPARKYRQAEAQIIPRVARSISASRRRAPLSKVAKTRGAKGCSLVTNCAGRFIHSLARVEFPKNRAALQYRRRIRRSRSDSTCVRRARGFRRRRGAAAGAITPGSSCRARATRLRVAIGEAQAMVPGYSYKGFCVKVVRAGCAGYAVSLHGKRVLYYGRTGETHTEYFPGTRPSAVP